MSSTSAGSSSKKPSGYFNRKSKLQHTKEDKIQSKALHKFITASTSSTKLDKDDIAITANVKEDELPILEALTTASTSHRANETDQKLSGGTPSTLLLMDCGEWPQKITDEIRKLLTEHGPVQVADIDFPIDGEMDSSQIPTCSTELVSHAGSQTTLPSWQVKKECRNEIKTENLLRQKTFVIEKKCLSKTKEDKCASIEKPPSSQKQRKKWDLEAAKLYWSKLNENQNKLCTQYSKNYSYRSTVSLPSSLKSSPAQFEYLTISVDNILNSANSLYSLKEFFPRSPKRPTLNICVDNIISNNEPEDSLVKIKINEYYKLKILLAENEENCRQLKKMIHKKKNEINLIRTTDKKNIPPCKKQLFQHCKYSKEENAAAIIISAYVRGYLLRCLLNTQVVQRTIETIQKLQACTLKEPMKCKSKELDRDRKLTQKLLAASNKLHSVISLPPGKKIALIRQDRAEVKHHMRMCRPTSAYVTTLSTRRDCLRSAELTYDKCMKRRAHSSNPIDRWHY